MERREKWPEDVDPWCDHVLLEKRHSQQDQSLPEMQFPQSMTESRESFLRQVRLFRAKILNGYDRYTVTGALQYSVSLILISFVTFWMSCISAILAGLIVISTFSITVMVNFGRRTRAFVRNMKGR